MLSCITSLLRSWRRRGVPVESCRSWRGVSFESCRLCRRQGVPFDVCEVDVLAHAEAIACLLLRIHAEGRSLKTSFFPANDAVLAKKMATELLEKGIYVIGFFYPVVPKGEARIRVQISAAMDIHQLDEAVDAFTEVGKNLNVLT